MIEVFQKTEATWLSIRGKFNFGCYREFQAAIAGPPPGRYVVDLTRTEYLDSSALGMLLLLREKVGDDRERVVIQPGGGQPREVLRLANFEKLFTIEA